MNCLLLCLIFYLPSAGDYFEQGNRYYEKHQYSEAIRVYEIAVELEPENGLSWAALGSAFGENREYEKALESLKKAVTLAPRLTEAYPLITFYYI